MIVVYLTLNRLIVILNEKNCSRSYLQVASIDNQGRINARINNEMMTDLMLKTKSSAPSTML